MDASDASLIGSTCLCLHVRRAARAVSRLYDDALRPVALSNGQFSLMTMLAAKEDWGMQGLSDALMMDRSSLTAALKPLERRDLVVSGANDSDKRVRQLRLTLAGRALLDAALPLWAGAQTRAEALLRDRSPVLLRDHLTALS